MWLSKHFLFLGIALALPFFTANLLVVMQAEFFLSLLRPFGETTNYEQILVLALVALVGLGGILSLVSVIRERRLYIVNVVVGVALIAFALFAGYGLGLDVYHCDILQIPNCD